MQKANILQNTALYMSLYVSFQTINGLMQREDWTSAIKTPVGCVPGGSGNALACAINYAAGCVCLSEGYSLFISYIHIY